MTIRHTPDQRPHYETEAVRRLTDLAHARGWTLDVEPTTRFAARLTLPDAPPSTRRHLIIGADLGLNSAAAARVAKDKTFAHHFLELDGLPTVPTFPITAPDHAAELIASRHLRFPLVIKPNRSHEARGLSLVHTHSDLPAAIDAARTIDPIVLLQPFDPRPEFRLLMLAGEFIAAFQKHPAAPLAPANLATGATWTERTSDVSPDHIELARRAASSLSLTLAAVDLLTTDITTFDGNSSILEVNASPGLKALACVPEALERLFSALAEQLERGTPTR